MSNGKGDTTRPPSVPRDTFAANWDRTFGSPVFAKLDNMVANMNREAAMYERKQRLIARTNHLPDSPDAPET